MRNQEEVIASLLVGRVFKGEDWSIHSMGGYRASMDGWMASLVPNFRHDSPFDSTYITNDLDDY
jgi:hypothetical protein